MASSFAMWATQMPPVVCSLPGGTVASHAGIPVSSQPAVVLNAAQLLPSCPPTEPAQDAQWVHDRPSCLHLDATGIVAPRQQVPVPPPDPSLHEFSSLFPAWEVDEMDFEDACTLMRDAARRAGISANRREHTDQSAQCNLGVPSHEDDKPSEPEVSHVVGDISIQGVVQLHSAGDTGFVNMSDMDSATFDRYDDYCKALLRAKQERQDNWSRYDLALKRYQRWLQTQRRPPLERIPKHREAFPQRPACQNPTSLAMQARIRRVYDHAHGTPLHEDDSYVYKFLEERRAKHADAYSGVNTCSGSRRYDRCHPAKPYVPYEPRGPPGGPVRGRVEPPSVQRHRSTGRQVTGRLDQRSQSMGVSGLEGPPRTKITGGGYLQVTGSGKATRESQTRNRLREPVSRPSGYRVVREGQITLEGESGQISFSGSLTLPLKGEENRPKLRRGTPPPPRETRNRRLSS
ncbi:hypothetical protein CSUI_007215 [Cystoisospora suis]|uniref:Uncharacterized protein n=1 Tax=Cystoisospora suis TaxID=483139 RepID=A0A2C6KRD3_9APIC|nr:hypothetical protein CSUI_007215 [Cystoisospora suis]